MYSYVIKKDAFEVFFEGSECASANCFWYKMPEIIDGKITNKKKYQIYVTDVISHKEGFGSLLMNFVVTHFNSIKDAKPKNGYKRNTLWLKVLKYNERAFYLYKKFGFELDTVHYDDEYVWMYKKL